MSRVPVGVWEVPVHPHDAGMTQTLLHSLTEAVFPPGCCCILKKHHSMVAGFCSTGDQIVSDTITSSGILYGLKASYRPCLPQGGGFLQRH